MVAYLSVSVLDKLARIRGVTWEWEPAAAALGKEPGAPDAGVIADEVEAVFPDLVVTKEGYKHVNYAGLIGLLIEAVKELKAENDALRRRIDKLEREGDGLCPAGGEAKRSPQEK